MGLCGWSGELGDPTLDGYVVQYAQSTTEPDADSDDWETSAALSNFNARSHTVTGLTNGQDYWFRVAGILTDASGTVTDTSDNFVVSDPSIEPAAGAPGRPTNVVVTQTSERDDNATPTDLTDDTASVTVTWDAPENNGGSPIIGYVVVTAATLDLDNLPSFTAVAKADLDEDALDTATGVRFSVDRSEDFEGVEDDDDFAVIAVNETVLDENAADSLETDDVEETASASAQSRIEMFDLEEAAEIEELSFSGTIESDSTTGGGAPQLTVTINSLPSGLPVGTSIVLYLEDDYGVDSIPASSVYFIADRGRTVPTGAGAAVYATRNPKIDTDAYFDATKKDISIRVSIPDMCTNATNVMCEGPNGPESGQRLTMVIEDTSGISNPTEFGSHSAAFAVVAAGKGVPGPAAIDSDEGTNVGGDTVADLQALNLMTVAKVSLDDNNNKRGFELTVTGTGYNDGTTATAYVLAKPTAAQWWDSLDCGEMVDAVNDPRPAVEATNPYCKMYDGLGATEMTRVREEFGELTAGFLLGSNGCTVVVAHGTSIGSTNVGTNDAVAIPVTVTVPIFKPGKVNYICVSDGESRGSGADVEIFELEDSIRVVPMEVNAGDTVTIFAEDFIDTPGNAGFSKLELGGVTVYPSEEEDTEYEDLDLQAGGIGNDGSDTVTFVMPPTIGGNPIKGTIQVKGTWGGEKGPNAATKITVKPAGLTLTKSEARANESITIQGSGFSNTSVVEPENITIDDVPLLVDADSLRDDVVKISNGGQFVATIYLWPDDDGDANPALVTGIHTIRVEDNDGFVGTTNLSIIEPTITVVPLVAGPRDIVVIRGENFPVDNVEGGAVNAVTITVNDSRERNYSEIPDGSGRFTVEHQVSSNVAIPSVATVKATYGTEITKTGSFDVPEAIITVVPALAAPGESLTLSVEGMPVYASVDSITVGGRESLGNLNVNTDRDGAVTVEGVVVPGLDPGIFSVQLEVNDIVAIGQVEVVSEGPRGLSTAVGDALAEVGDNLVVVWHFNTDSKLDFAQFKRRKRGNLRVGGIERQGVPACRSWRLTSKNPPTPATGGVAPGRWRLRRLATVCRTRPRWRWVMGCCFCNAWAARAVQEKRPSRVGVVRAMARSDHWRWVSTPRWVLTS